LDPGAFDGGLEHRSSCVINTANSEPLMIDELLAHEYFHAWNVKQMRPKVLGPFDYSQPNRTANLWFAEGVTDYYGYLTTYQSSLQSEEWLLESFSFNIAELQNSKVRLQKTLEEVCKGTWETGGFGNDDLSYYTKGLVVGLIFDSVIRKTTDGKKSLDDVMRMLYKRHKLPNPGYGEDDIRLAINETAGVDLSDLYNRMVRSTLEVPYENLSAIGLRVATPGKPQPSLGFASRGAQVSEVGSVMLNAGLREKDRISEVNGKPYAEGVFAGLSVGDEVTLTVDRKGTKMQFKTKVQMVDPQGYRLERDPFAGVEATKLLNQWLAKPSRQID
jgi:predicted metalloprotease with PDZ domain